LLFVNIDGLQRFDIWHMILTINGGSSSIKFALYQQGHSLNKCLSGQISRIGLAGTELTFKKGEAGEKQSLPVKDVEYTSAIHYLIRWLSEQINFTDIKAIGHRVVHGMQHTKPAFITTKLLKDLKNIVPYDPDHLPGEIELITVFQKHYPNIPQFVCFDTAFHQTMPRVAKLLPIPRRFDRMGVRRYGFHGLSYNYLFEELENIAGKASHGRVVLAHLGNGASLAAIYKGKSIDTSMGFTPAGGLPMSSRSGDIDPGVAWFMIKNESLSPQKFNHLINHESGLLGISETSGDMNDLLKHEAKDTRCAEAVNLFCYQVKKYIGAYAAALGGIDFLVFSGGIGENAPEIRSRICEGLEFLGIELDNERNKLNSPFISANESRVTVRIIPTDEELMIAKIVGKLLAKVK
jgi:acetate kinase